MRARHAEALPVGQPDRSWARSPVALSGSSTAARAAVVVGAGSRALLASARSRGRGRRAAGRRARARWSRSRPRLAHLGPAGAAAARRRASSRSWWRAPARRRPRPPASMALALRHNRFLAAGLDRRWRPSALGLAAARRSRPRWRARLAGAARDAARDRRRAVAVDAGARAGRAGDCWPASSFSCSGDARAAARPRAGAPRAARSRRRRSSLPWVAGVGRDAAPAPALARRAALLAAAAVTARRGLAALARNWTDNLRFAPWIDIGVGAAIAGWSRSSAPWLLRDRWPRRAARGRVAGRRRAPSSLAGGAAARRQRLRGGAQGRRRPRRPRRRRCSRSGRQAARLRRRRLRAAARRRRLRRPRSRRSTPGRSTCPGDGIDSDCDGQDADRGAAAGRRHGAACPRRVPARSQPRVPHDRHAARRSPRLLRLRAPDLARRSTRWRREGDAVRERLGPRARRRATRCRRSRPGAGRRRSSGTNRSGGRASAAACARSPRRCTTTATSRAACSASATSRSPIAAASSAAWTSTTPIAPRCTSRSTARWSRAARRRARWPTTPSPSSTRTGPEVLPVAALLRSAPVVRAARRGAVFGTARVDLYDGEIRFTDLHVGRVLAHLRGAGPVGPHGGRAHRRSRRGLRRARRDRARLRPLRAADARAVHRARAGPAAAARARARRATSTSRPRWSTWRAASPSRASSGARWCPSSRARGPTRRRATRAVFQEVTSERGKKRALVTATRHLLWNWVPDNTTECYDRARDPAETHDLWGRGGRRRRRAHAAQGRAAAPRRRRSRCRRAPPRRWRAA